MKIKTILTLLCRCADSGVQQRSHMYWNLCMFIGPSGSWGYMFMSWTWLISYLLESGGFYEADASNRVSRRTVGGKCHHFPWSHMCLSATQLRVPPGMIQWSIGSVSHSAPVPGLAARAHWLSTLLLHQQSIRDPSLFTSHVFQLQQYIPCLKNIGKCICALCRNSWVCLYSWVHVRRWGIELFTARLRPWWLNWDLLLYLPGRRGVEAGGGGGKSNRRRLHCVPLLHCWEHCGCYN